MARSLTELLSGPFVWGAGGAKLSPEDIAMRREEAGELAKSAVDFSPVGHWSQGLGRVANALMAGMDYRTANAAQKESDAFSNGALDEALGVAPAAASPSPVGTMTGAAPAVLPQPGASSEIAASKPFSGGQQEFVDMLLPAAIEEGRRTGIDPRIIVAQAAQETGWGRSAPGNNFFGIKSHGQGGGNNLMTTEYINGQPVQQRDSFRAYGSPQESVRGYGDFILQNPRYGKLRAAQGLDNQLAELQASGYATDPNYGRSVGAIARGIQLPSETASLDPSIGMTPAAAAIETQAPRSGYVDPMVSSPNYDPAVAGAEAGTQVAQAPQDRGIIAALSGSQGQGIGNPKPAPSSAPARVGGVDQRILRALADPRLNQQGRSVLQVLAQQQVAEQRAAQEQQTWEQRQQQQQQMRQADPAYQLGLEKSRLELDAMRNPQPQIPDSVQALNMRAEQAGLVPGTPEYRDFMVSGGRGPLVSVNTGQDESEFAKKAAGRNVDRFGALADAGTQAAGVAQSIPVMRELLSQAPQGPVSGRLAEMFPGFSSAGDAFMAQVSQIAPTLRVPGSGALSDRDMDILMSSFPRLRADPTANQMIMNVFERKAQLNADRGAIASAALRDEITPAEADKRIAEIDKQPLLDERTRSLLTNAGKPPEENPLPPTPGRGPQAGTVEDGFRFKGGDPRDPNNWEQVQ